MFLVALVCLFVCLFEDNTTQNVRKRLKFYGGVLGSAMEN